MSQKNQRASELNHSETVFSAKWTKNRQHGQMDSCSIASLRLSERAHITNALIERWYLSIRNLCFRSAMWLSCLQSWHQIALSVSAYALADLNFAERFIPIACNGPESKLLGDTTNTRPSYGRNYPKWS
jgi:hypothetical protein